MFQGRVGMATQQSFKEAGKCDLFSSVLWLCNIVQRLTIGRRFKRCSGDHEDRKTTPRATAPRRPGGAKQRMQVRINADTDHPAVKWW